MSLLNSKHYTLSKKTFFFFLIFLSQLTEKAFSQHLNYSDILNVYKSNSESNESFLTKKGFTFFNSEKNDETKNTIITWMYKRPGSNTGSSNEYIIKECTNLFQGNCEIVTYYTVNEEHFNFLKTSMKTNFYKFLYSNTNKNGGLSHHYLIPAAGLPGPTEASFETIPKNEKMKTNIYVFSLRKINVGVKDGN